MVDMIMSRTPILPTHGNGKALPQVRLRRKAKPSSGLNISVHK